MAITSSQRTAPPRAGAWGLLIIVVLAVPARAADWSVAPALRLRESYSDNALLAPPEQARGDFISEISPSLVVHGKGPRLRLDLAYSLQQILYQRRPDRSNHQLQADANGELLQDWLYVDARASVSQQNVSGFGPQALDNLAVPGSQSTVQATQISPYLRRHLRGLGSAELRYTHAEVSNGDALLTVKTDELLLDLVGDTGAGGLGWDAHLDRRQTRNRRQGTRQASKAALSLRYMLSSHFNVFASAGYEREAYAAADGAAPGGRHWSLGLGWYPSNRSNIVVSAGKRFFGNTYAVDANYRSRRINWSLGYHEDISNTPAQLLRLSAGETANLLDQLWSGAMPDPQLRRRRVDTFMRFSQLLGPDVGAVNYFSEHYYLQKQLSLSMAAATPKSTLVLGLTATRRTAQSKIGIDSLLLPDLSAALEERTRQLGASAGWNWRLSSRSSVNASAAYGAIESLGLGRKDRNLALSVGITRTLQPKLTAALDLRRVQHSSNRGGNYRENAISASLIFQL
ncbi:TIGR03016 family PEP-CTERM system-associated outer membrane protein [Janthinobacterium fluminis]|uniref:TIGR03016 family PEP-CTERM system-associated outer membrane protein n=1 Tax=Janthinobacterium fluminis TaxID=2987524 RepID=A0ABT5JXJ6_9BURK|nr:TIGR03016 family PEP-CTERM system-associated outer membrane protein [Janthinobacterium fluminis]MDC8756868.1 TIGR03016 family PEP-CTERM system-associated outer membrane protein [Janthinobacterium fluminis]